MADLVVTTKQGQLKGIEKLDCIQFRGVPFAQPPVGELRWQPPQPPQAWDGVRDASEFGPMCPQVAGTMEGLIAANNRDAGGPMSEDCLTLNVYTPSLDGAAPVMLWIHGGGFSTGSGRIPWYSGHTFARDGVVVVTINYRVNAFGFLELGELLGEKYAGSGNIGILDQIAALEWVRDNIASFGGDASNVTIFGESAGGGSVGTLLGSPTAKGLFHKAIPQSGAAHWSHSRETAARIGRAFAEAVAVEAGDVDGMLTLSSDAIIEGVKKLEQSILSDNAQVFGPDHTGASMLFQPVFGGDELPRAAIDALRDGSGADVPTLVGTNKDEWNLFTLMAKPETFRGAPVRPLRKLCESKGRSVDELVGAYESDKHPSNELEMRNLLETDRMFRIPAIRLAEAQVANGAPTWMYRFDWESPALEGRFRACHALEIPFVFDNLEAPGIDIFTGGAAPQPIATKMHAAWVAFAKTGDPNSGELPEWPKYEPKARSTMLMDTESGVASDPDGPTRAIWDGLL